VVAGVGDIFKNTLRKRFNDKQVGTYSVSFNNIIMSNRFIVLGSMKTLTHKKRARRSPLKQLNMRV